MLNKQFIKVKHFYTFYVRNKPEINPAIFKVWQKCSDSSAPRKPNQEGNKLLFFFIKLNIFGRAKETWETMCQVCWSAVWLHEIAMNMALDHSFLDMVHNFTALPHKGSISK